MQIDVDVENVSDVKRKLTVEVSASEAAKAYQEIVGKFKNMARLPGFRPGKAPIGLIKTRFRSDIEEELFQTLIPEAYKEAIEQKELSPLGSPQIEDYRFQEGEALVFAALLEIAPDFELPNYKGLHVDAQESAVTEGDIQAELDRLRDAQGSLVAVEDRPVQAGDFTTIDFEGWYLEEGQRPEKPGIEERGIVLEVGGEHSHAAFGEALIGMSRGESKTFDTEYPADYPQESLAGRHVSFDLRLIELKAKEVPDLDDDFAKDLGEFENLQELRDDVRGRLDAKKDHDREQQIRTKLVEQLIQDTQFEVPDVLVEERIDQRIREVAYNMSLRGLNPTQANVDWSGVRTDLRPGCVDDVKLALVLARIADESKIETSDEELESEIESIAAARRQPVEKIRQEIGQGEALEDVRMRLSRRKALDLVRESAIVSGA